jgi:hypothetical protein
MLIDNYSVFLIREGAGFDISGLCGDLSWRDSIDTLGMELQFTTANSDARYFPKLVVQLGDLIVLSNNGVEVFRGIVTDESIDGRFSRSFTAFDFAFYLNKSKTIIQFNKMRADEAIKKLCNQFNIAIGTICPISTLISAIYKDKTIAEIIEDILEQVTKELGIKFRKEMRIGKFYIEKYTDLIVKGLFKPASNIQAFDVTKAIGSVSRSRSIADMKNSILIVSSEEKSTRVAAKAEDSSSIKKYGLLQEIESVDSKDIAQARNIAKNKLAELNKIAEDTTIELLGSDLVRAGRILEIIEPITGLNGKYLVKECTHTYKNRIHKMSLTIEGV